MALQGVKMTSLGGAVNVSNASSSSLGSVYSNLQTKNVRTRTRTRNVAEWNLKVLGRDLRPILT